VVYIPVLGVAATDDNLDHELIGLRFRDWRVLDRDLHALTNNSFLHVCVYLLCLCDMLLDFNWSRSCTSVF
jgi:hypothetical protein